MPVTEPKTKAEGEKALKKFRSGISKYRRAQLDNDLKGMAARWTPDAVRTLVNIMKGTDKAVTPQHKLAASKILLEYGHGRAAQSVHVEGSVATGPVFNISILQIDGPPVMKTIEAEVIREPEDAGGREPGDEAGVPGPPQEEVVDPDGNERPAVQD